MEKLVWLVAIFALAVGTVHAGSDKNVNAANSVQGETCDSRIVDQACVDGLKDNLASKYTQCTAGFGAFSEANKEEFASDIQDLVQNYLEISMKYLELANYFNEWNVNRKGFHSYYSKLSDEAWEDAVTIMQHMIKRGGSLKKKFEFKKRFQFQDKTRVEAPFVATQLSNLSELSSLSMALEWQKEVVKKTLDVLKRHQPRSDETGATSGNTNTYAVHSDPEFTHFLAQQLSERQVLKVKHLANYVNSLSGALSSTSNTGVVLHLFDSQVLK